MNQDLVAFSGGSYRRTVQRTNRSIATYRVGGELSHARIEVDTDLGLAKQDALSGLTGNGMQNVVKVAQARRQLEQMVPEASGHLEYLQGVHAFAMADVVQDAARKWRRL